MCSVQEAGSIGSRQAIGGRWGGGGAPDDRLDSFTIDTFLLPGPVKQWRNQEANRSSLKITKLPLGG
jgi:hypothetical protein